MCVAAGVFFAAKVSADYSRQSEFREKCIAQMKLKSYTSYSKKHHQIESDKCIIIFRKHVSETLGGGSYKMRTVYRNAKIYTVNPHMPR